MEPQEISLDNSIITDLKQSIFQSSKELERRMLCHPYEEYIKIIKDQSIELQIKQAACAALKLSLMQEKFSSQADKIFQQLAFFYLEAKYYKITKIQRAAEIVLQRIIRVYWNKEKKIQFSLQFIFKNLANQTSTIIKKLSLFRIVLHTLDPQTVNDQVFIGELLLFWKDFIMVELQTDRKIDAIGQIIKTIQFLINKIDEIEEDENFPQSYLKTSENGKQLLEHVILLESNHSRIITKNSSLNKVKTKALRLYAETWIFDLEQHMFYPFLNSLLNSPKVLFNEEAEIMSQIISLLQRSVQQQCYQTTLHRSASFVVLKLCDLMCLTEDQLQMMETSPNQFVNLLEEYGEKSSSQELFFRAGNYLASLCANVDGYLTFVGNFCLVVLKKVDNSLFEIPNNKEFIKNIDEISPASDEKRLQACLLITIILSDQIPKRRDIFQPMMISLRRIQSQFWLKPEFSPQIICLFMLVYTFYAYPGCLDAFLKYKKVKQVFAYELESCYRILENRHQYKDEIKNYAFELGRNVIICDHLTPLFQHTIMSNDKMRTFLQVPLLEKLVSWLLKVYNSPDQMATNKYFNLIGQVLSKWSIQDNLNDEGIVYQYLLPVYQLLENSHPYEQSIVEIASQHIQKFSDFSQQKQIFFLRLNFIYIKRNKFLLNSCLNALAALVEHFSYDLLFDVIKQCEKIFPEQETEEDLWEWVYLFEICIVRIGKLELQVPPLTCLSFLLSGLSKAKSKILSTKILMTLMSIIFVTPNFSEELLNFLKIQNYPSGVPPYENKAYCFYLMGMFRVSGENVYFGKYLLRLIYETFQRENNKENNQKLYKQKIYTFDEDTDIVATSSFMKSQTMTHPLCRDECDLYKCFKVVWESYQYKQQLKEILSQSERQNVKDLWNKQVIQNTVRKVLNVKKLKLE